MFWAPAKSEFAYRLNLMGSLFSFIWVGGTILAWSILGNYMNLPIPKNLVAPYFLLVGIFSFSSAFTFAHRISAKIKKGDIAIKLRVPYGLTMQFILDSFFPDILVYTVPGVVSFIIIMALLNVHLTNLPYAVLIAVLGSISIVQIAMTVGMLAFWIEESWGFINAVNAINMFLSGSFIPLNMLPGIVREIAYLLPMKLIGYTPTMIALGLEKPSLDLIILGLVWAVITTVIARLTLHFGLKTVSIHGV